METEKTEIESQEITLQKLEDDFKYRKRRLVENSLFLLCISFVYFSTLSNTIQNNSFGSTLDYSMLVFYCIVLTLSIMALNVAWYNFRFARGSLYWFTADPDEMEASFNKYLEEEENKK